MAARPIPAPSAEGHTRTTSAPLYWCRYGPADRQPVLVLHGGPGAHHDYLLPQLLALESVAGEPLLFYDQRGGGRSRTGDREPVTWQVLAADAAAVIAEFRLERPLVVGYSWGGLLALLHAARAASTSSADKPGALVLIDPAPVTRQYRDDFEREFARRQAGADVARLRAELAGSGLRERDPEAYRLRNFELSVAGYFANPQSARDLTPFRVSARVQQSVRESLGNFDLIGDGTLARINVPALVVHGRQDPIPLASSRAAAEAMGATFRILDDCGHVPYVEQPDALFDAIGSFLKQLPASGNRGED